LRPLYNATLFLCWFCRDVYSKNSGKLNWSKFSHYFNHFYKHYVDVVTMMMLDGIFSFFLDPNKLLSWSCAALIYFRVLIILYFDATSLIKTWAIYFDLLEMQDASMLTIIISTRMWQKFELIWIHYQTLEKWRKYGWWWWNCCFFFSEMISVKGTKCSLADVGIKVWIYIINIDFPHLTIKKNFTQV